MMIWTRVRVSAVAAGVLAGVVLAPVAMAEHPDYNLSSGIYRIPYADGTEVTIGGDNHSHGGPDGNRDRVDMNGADGTDSVIVAAASGWIRGIVEHNGDSNGNGDGLDINGNPHDDSLEHSCSSDAEEAAIAGDCQDYNNYVWIEHPNGEWTKYSHMATGIVSANGWAVGDWIDAGDVLGTEGDIGKATGPHLHWEVAVPNDPTDDTPFGAVGGFIQGTNSAAVICDIGGEDSVFTQGNTHTAAPCTHEPPTADAGAPYVVPEGSSLELDGTASSDPEGNPLTYAWSPAGSLDDAASATPTYTAVDGPASEDLTLTVYDQIEQLPDSDTTTVEVLNVAPTVTAVGASANEGDLVVVSATVTDPGTLDTHTATIDWGDGGAAMPVSIGALAGGVGHTYGDNGVYDVVITVTDDDGGVGIDTVSASVGNLPPALALDVSDAVAFPGGSYQVVEVGGSVPLSADGTDAGSDDLTFAWSSGQLNTYFNNGMSPDLPSSPGGTFPFAVSDEVSAGFGTVGVGSVALTLSDDDGGAIADSAGVIVTGIAEDTQGRGWWRKQYAPAGATHVDPATAAAYLDIVRAVSTVFDEAAPLSTSADAVKTLTPAPSDARARARAELLTAWLELASGAVPWDATVTLHPGVTVSYLDLMADAEEAILDPAATAGHLLQVEQNLSKVRHA